MRNLVRLVDAALLPVVGVVFGVLWIIGTANTISDRTPVEWIPYALIGVAIATARLSSAGALSLVISGLAVQAAVPRLRFAEGGWPAYAGLLIVLFVVAAKPDARSRVFGLIVGVTGSVAVGILVGAAGGQPLVAMLVAGVSTVAAWVLGLAVTLVRQRNVASKRSRALEHEVDAAATELAVARERERTAQDVHDIMAHSLAVIVAQADGALFLQGERPAAATESLTAISVAARESLGELRVMLQSLTADPEGHSHPTLQDLDSLLARMRSAGLRVSETTFGEPGLLTAGQQLAVYRIVQESLTNALKHSGPTSEVRVTQDWRGPGLALGVTSIGGHEPRPGSPAGTSRGITGMTERARLAGGWLVAEQDHEDARTFVVTAFIPTVAAPSVAVR
ncbi:Sensor histidine kinase DesK [Frondihabitans sp. 762G35]|uniref:sensor histidine kinase n=1 Tax=Frondihabitans sp. 762G35 TaxID=1446794 RepID=UPI000D21C569|nr:histidine kinase [Frondihabitans sp. 762G35]ARC56161.1 Sensor histidine kinase DesK [Frondihabitans sp. 762G35]